MATKKKSGYSKGAKELLLKADKYLSKGDSAPFSRMKRAEKAGINSKLGDSKASKGSVAFYGASEYRNLEKEIAKVKPKKQK